MTERVACPVCGAESWSRRLQRCRRARAPCGETKRPRPRPQVRKVTARGGGAALPLRPRLFARLVAAAVEGAGGAAAVTVKLRIGLARDPAEMTYFLEVRRTRDMI